MPGKELNSPVDLGRNLPVHAYFLGLRRFIRTSLIAKLLLATVPLIFLSVLALTLVLPRWISQAVFELHRAQLVEQSAVLESALQHAFMTSDSHLIQNALENASGNSEVLSLRLLSPASVIIASSSAGEVGKTLDVAEEPCNLCHLGGAQSASPVVRAASLGVTASTLITAQPIDNQLACRTCHDASESTLGVLLMESSPAGLDLSVERLSWGLAAGGGILLELTLIVLIAILHRSFVRPLHKLSASIPGRGRHQDEITAVAAHISELEAGLASKQEEATARFEDLEALLTIAEATAGSLSVGRVMQQALDTVLAVTGFSTGGMRLWDREARCYRLVAHSGMTPQMVRELACVPEGAGFQGEAAASLTTVFSSNLPSDPRSRSHSAIVAGFRSLICTPLVAGDTLVGIMDLASKDARDWSQAELRWIAVIGQQIGIAVHRIQLSRQTQNMAVIEERGRVSQELHDGLAQLIGSIRAKAEELQLSVESKDWSAARRNAKEVEQTAADAYASLRQELLGLREQTVPTKGLGPLLAAYLERFQRQWGIETELQRSNDSIVTADPGVEVQILRIVQEAIANVRRHAAANRVIVRLEQHNETLRVTVEDDGRGFSSGQDEEEGHLGLRIMRERAASVGGRLMIQTCIGGGTTVSVEAPRRLTESIGYPGEIP